ncbi:MAG TPA: sulfatase-like hydrolase/transferase [Clostridiaceae bacterium]|nr:sulfatase-like hydrolase/transferase [Clostridiaceae bacterium]
MLLLDRMKTQIKRKSFIEGAVTFIAIVVLSILIMSITFAFSSAAFNLPLFKSYFKGPLLLLMNFIPIFLFMMFVYLLTNRLWAAFSLTSLLFVTMSIVNKFKLMYRDDPFVFVDVKLVGESLIMAQKYNIRLSLKMIVLIIALIVLAIMLKIFFKYKIASRKVRISSLVALILAGIAIFKGFYFNADIYKKVGDKSLINIWIASEQFQSKGFVYPFIYSIKDAIETPPEGYDEKKAVEELAARNYSDIPEDQKVNIISIMLESFNDFSVFKDVEFGIDIYENFHQLQKESIHGNLIVNVFAGDTINTERAFITGYYNHPNYYRKTNSFVWYFKEQGYRTEASHPITGSFYNRRNVNEYLGFDSFDHYDNKYRYVQESYLEDFYFFDYIIEGFKNNKKNNQPYFHFSVTYQNHGPYSTEKYTEKEYLKKKDGYDEANYNIINNYFAGIYKTDQAIKKLVDYFRNEEEPTIILLFGDHNPWLGKDHTGYDMLNINLDLSTVEGFVNYFQTPYIIWANDSAKEMFNKDFIGKGNTVSPNFLMAELFQHLGWEGNEYMQCLFDMKEKFDVNHKLYFKENGEYKSELSPENKELWNTFLSLEYYYSHKYYGHDLK